MTRFIIDVRMRKGRQYPSLLEYGHKRDVHCDLITDTVGDLSFQFNDTPVYIDLKGPGLCLVPQSNARHITDKAGRYSRWIKDYPALFLHSLVRETALLKDRQLHRVILYDNPLSLAFQLVDGSVFVALDCYETTVTVMEFFSTVIKQVESFLSELSSMNEHLREHPFFKEIVALADKAKLELSECLEGDAP